MEVLNDRMREAGFKHVIVRWQGSDRVVIEIPALPEAEIDRITGLITRTGKLEFRLVKERRDARHILGLLGRALLRLPEVQADSHLIEVAGALSEDSETYTTYGGTYVAERDHRILRNLLSHMNADSLLPSDATLGFSAEPQDVYKSEPGRILYVMNRRAELGGEHISDAKANVGLDRRSPGSFGVSMNLDKEGALIFRKVTGTNVGRQLAIVVDGQVMSAPSIRGRIPSGNASITGSFTDVEARDLATTLRTGSLPVPLRLVESKVLQNVP